MIHNCYGLKTSPKFSLGYYVFLWIGNGVFGTDVPPIWRAVEYNADEHELQG